MFDLDSGTSAMKEIPEIKIKAKNFRIDNGILTICAANEDYDMHYYLKIALK
jgi:hypothetical protein